MNTRWHRSLLLAGSAMVAATVALGQQTGSPTAGGAHGAPTVPDFSGIWWHPSLPGFEPPRSGPGPVTNRSRRNGASDYSQLVGDYTNPILRPEAAAIVKQYGDLSLAGVTYPNPANSCWPEPVPFIYKNFATQLLQQPDKIIILYEQDHEFRVVRLNQQHPARVKPAWYGDSVGLYEGDTLVVDTVGIKTERPFGMIDLYGTPYTDKLHVVERFRLLDYADAKEGLDRDAKENFRPPVGIDRGYRGKHLQVQFTVEDPNVFTTPWTATITYGRGSTDWPETVCAENIHKYYEPDTQVPTAPKADF